MPKTVAASQFVLSAALLNPFDINSRINHYMIDNLAAQAWRAEPPGGKGRDAASIAAHRHNVRIMWLKATAKGNHVPGQLNRHTVTPAEARKGLQQSHDAL